MVHYCYFIDYLAYPEHTMGIEDERGDWRRCVCIFNNGEQCPNSARKMEQALTKLPVCELCWKEMLEEESI